MEIAGRTFDVENDDVRRQQIVKASLDNRRRLFNGRSNFQMDHLPQRVNAGIGPSRSLHVDVAPEDLARRVAELSHHRPRVLLLLPTAVPRTVVFN